MTRDLFPSRERARRSYRPGITNPEWGADADAWDHRQKSVDRPTLEVEDPGEVGRIYAPDGQHFRVVLERDKHDIGFRPR